VNSNTISVGEIRLRKQARLLRRRGILRMTERLAGDPLGELGHALRLVAIAAELLVELQRMQPIEPRLERRFAIRFPEETRVSKPRRHDAFGVLRNHALVGRLGVDDRQERLLQIALLRDDGKVVLVMNEGGREHFVGQIEKPAVVEPGDRRPDTRPDPQLRR
jgi:hypothetical protein